MQRGQCTHVCVIEEYDSLSPATFNCLVPLGGEGPIRLVSGETWMEQSYAGFMKATNDVMSSQYWSVRQELSAGTIKA